MKRFIFLLIFTPFFLLSQELEEPIIEQNSGFYTQEFQLTISHPDPDVTILYTIDGSEPRIENLTGKEWFYKIDYPTYPNSSFGELLEDTIWTYEYSSEILINDISENQDRFADISPSYFMNESYNQYSKADSVNVFKGWVLRAVAYKDGQYSSIVSRNYFINALGSDRYSLPIICLNIDPEEFFGYERGLNVPGLLFDQWRQENPTMPLIDDIYSPANYNARTDTSELELSFVYLENGDEILNHHAGLRVNGKGSRVYPNRSYRLYARNAYGEKNFKHQFFDGSPDAKFKRLILRNSGQDCMATMFRDAFIQQSSKNLNVGIQEFAPVILFVNGEYFGLYNLRERYDKKFFNRVYDIPEDELDYVKIREVVEIKEGSNQAYMGLRSFVENNSLTDENNFQYINDVIDLENYTDYYAIEIFAGNIDWPFNNNEFWRMNTGDNTDPNVPYGKDGRLRWLLKDLDLSFGLRWDYASYDFDDLTRVSTVLNSTNPLDTATNYYTTIFRALLENEDYKHYFINRFSDILNTTYKSELLVDNLIEIRNLIEPEAEENIQRWSPINQKLTFHQPIHSYSEWEGHVNDLIEFSEERQAHVRAHIENRFETEKLDLILDVSGVDHGYIGLNTIEVRVGTDGVDSLAPFPWEGVYFKEVPITLKAIPMTGYIFSHWSGDISETTEDITLFLNEDTFIKANFVLEEEGTIGVEEFTKNNDVKVYPNPFKDEITVLTDNYAGEYSIYSLQGEEVINGDFNSKTIRLDNLNIGVYILQIKQGGELIRKRIIKH